MHEWLRNRNERNGRDFIDAQYLIFIHGLNATAIAALRAKRAGASTRNLRHWDRVRRLIARLLKRNERRALAHA